MGTATITSRTVSSLRGSDFDCCCTARSSNSMSQIKKLCWIPLRRDKGLLNHLPPFLSSSSGLSPSLPCRPPFQFRSTIACDTLLDTTTDIEIEKLEAEVPALLALCVDLDWQKSANALRDEALGSLKSECGEDLRLVFLETVMDEWLHDGMVDMLLQPSGLAAVQTTQDELGLLQELRIQARLQAAEELVKDVDTSFNWETAAAELHPHVRNAEDLDSKDKLWQTWVPAREEMEEAADNLMETVDEQAIDVHLDRLCYGMESSIGKQEEHVQQSGVRSNSSSEKPSDWWTVGAAVGGLVGGGAMDALAADSSGPISLNIMPESVEAATRAPGWLAPSVLAFPVVSYYIFNVYRDNAT